MSKLRLAGVFVLAAAVCSTVLMLEPVTAQVKKGKTRVAQTKYLMRGVVQSNCAGLGKLLKGDGPGDDKAWDTAACHASCLNEMGHSLMADGRCPDKTWKESCDTLKKCSEVVLKAVEAKDAAKASSAFKQLTTACASCHKAHKK